ncbi:MAG TPA: cache domain-containing protein [Stellaceae bacterium]|nr:cache domain-containing protein [Stellaceae bacterium]
MLKTGKIIVAAGLALLLAGVMTPVRAATLEEAQALGDKAAALIVAEGEKAFPLISDPKGEFVQGDLYVTVLDHQGVVRATLNPKLVGMNMWESADPDGVKFTQDAVNIGETAGSGWQSYKFTNPVSKKIQLKKAWIRKAGDFVTLCGIYITN